MSRLNIIGGGISGLSAALGSIGGDVETHVWEKKKEIGSLYKSTGGIARYWIENLPFSIRWEKAVVDVIREVVIYPPDMEYPEVKLSSSTTIGYVLDQPTLEKTIEKKVRDDGVEIHRGVTINSINSMKDYIIGADGAFSTVARETVGLPDRWHMHKCLEYWFPREERSHRLEIYFRQYCPRGYIWVFPAGEYVKIGAGIPVAEKLELREIISRFLEETHYGRIGMHVGVYGGVVPTARPLAPAVISPRNNIALVGDAGRLVNSATGGGIHFALLSGYYAARSVATGHGFMLYKTWYSDKIYPQLERWYRIRSILTSSSPKELSEIISIAGDVIAKTFMDGLSTLNPLQLLFIVLANIALHPKTSIGVLSRLFLGEKNG